MGYIIKNLKKENEKMGRKFQIIDSIENAKNKLGYRDVDHINRTKMAAAKIQEEQEAKNVLNDVETQTCGPFLTKTPRLQAAQEVLPFTV